MPYRDGFSGGRKKRVIRPDAQIETESYRVFLEMDRGTELVAFRPARSTIEGKLQRYRRFLNGHCGQAGTCYAQKFTDSKDVLVVFVLPRRHPNNVRKRRVEEMFRKYRGVPARCLYLDELERLRGMVGLSPGHTVPDQSPRVVDVTQDDIQVLDDFYRIASPMLLDNQPDEPELRAEREARVVIERLLKKAA